MARIGTALAGALAMLAWTSACGGEETAAPSPEPPVSSPGDAGSGDPLVGGAAGMCVDGVRFDGRLYVSPGREPVSRAKAGDPVADVVRPGCNDTGGSIEPDEPVTAYELDGRPVDRALLVETYDGLRIYELHEPSS
jgi:hypothetical protein